MAEKLKATKSDIRKLYWRWNTIFTTPASYILYYGHVVSYGMSNALRRLYPNDDDYRAALNRESSFFITEQGFGSVILGICLAMEEEKANGAELADEDFIAIKGALMGPLAGFGDTMYGSILRVMLIAMFQPLAAEGMLIAFIAPILYNIAKFGMSWITLNAGYKYGLKAAENILENQLFKKILAAASVLSMFVMGGMTASYVKFSIALKYVGIYSTIDFNTLANKLLPGIFSIGPTLLIYYLINKKKVSVNKIIIAIMAIVFVLAYFKIV